MSIPKPNFVSHNLSFYERRYCRRIWGKERQNQLTGDHLNKLTHHSNKKAHLVMAGSHSHLHSARSDIFLLKLQMMAGVPRFERGVMLLESIGLPLTDTPITSRHIEKMFYGALPLELLPYVAGEDGTWTHNFRLGRLNYFKKFAVCVFMEEETRFELAEVLPSPPFQDGAINHSATLP